MKILRHDSLRIFRDLAILFPVIAMGLTLTGYLFGIGITPYHLWVSIFLTGLTALCFRQHALSLRISGFLIFLIIFITGAILGQFWIDHHWDTQRSIMPAMIVLGDGWNPLWKWAVPDSYLFDPFQHNLLRHYPKSNWIIGGLVTAATGLVEMAQSMNILLAMACLITAYSVMGKYLDNETWAMIAALVIAGNPIAIVQLGDGYQDGLMASSITLLSLFFLSYLKTRDTTDLWRATAILPYLIGIKLTGLPYAVIICAGFLTVTIYQNKELAFRYVKIILPAGIIATCLFNFNPYVTNTISHQNPFYPAWKPDGGNIIQGMASDEFHAMNRFSKFIIATFSEDKTADRHPILTNPLTSWELTVGPDTHMNGFGPGYDLIFIAAFLLLFALWKKPKALAFIFALWASVFITDAAWWARLTPHAWLATAIIPIFVLVTSQKNYWRWLAKGTLSLMLINSLALGAGMLASRTGKAYAFYQDIQFVDQEMAANQIKLDYYGDGDHARRFDFSIDHRIQALINRDLSFNYDDKCPAIQSNRVFRICRSNFDSIEQHGSVKLKNLLSEYSDFLIIGFKDTKRHQFPDHFFDQLESMDGHPKQIGKRGSYIAVIKDGKVVEETIKPWLFISHHTDYHNRDITIKSSIPKKYLMKIIINGRPVNHTAKRGMIALRFDEDKTPLIATYNIDKGETSATFIQPIGHQFDLADTTDFFTRSIIRNMRAVY
jgi:hypothetical protein